MISIINITIPLQCILKLFIFLFKKKTQMTGHSGSTGIHHFECRFTMRIGSCRTVAQREIFHGATVPPAKNMLHIYNNRGSGLDRNWAQTRTNS